MHDLYSHGGLHRAREGEGEKKKRRDRWRKREGSSSREKNCKMLAVLALKVSFTSY